MYKKIKKIKIGSLLFAIFAVLWSIITLYPLFWTIIASLKTNSEIFGQPFNLPSTYHFEYYYKALINANMAKCISNSMIITTATTLFTISIGSMASFVLSRFKFKFLNYIYILFIAGAMIPIHACMIPLLRIVNSLNGKNSYVTMILLYTAFSMPLAVFLITGYMKVIPKELDEAAAIDGCGSLALLVKIIMPIAAPILATTGILTFLFTYNDLIFSVLFISEKSMQTVSLGLLSFVGNRSTDYGPTFAAVIISIIPMIIMYLLFQEKVENGLASGSVKG